jgi:hypothetical protein
MTVVYFRAEEADPLFIPNGMGILHLFAKTDGFGDAVPNARTLLFPCPAIKHDARGLPALATILLSFAEKGQPDLMERRKKPLKTCFPNIIID